MRRSPLLLVGFTRFTDEGFSVKMNFIIDSMTGNVLYSDAGAKLTAVVDAFDAYQIVLGQKGTILNWALARDAARQDCYDALKALGVYIVLKYPKNAKNWQTTGYDVQTWVGTTEQPETPRNVEAKDGKNLGDLIVKCKTTKYAGIYEFRHWQKGTPAPAFPTKIVRKTTAKWEGLDAGKVYLVSVRANGTKGTSDWSRPIPFLLRNVAEEEE